MRKPTQTGSPPNSHDHYTTKSTITLAADLHNELFGREPVELFPHGGEGATENSRSEPLLRPEPVLDRRVINLFEITQRDRGRVNFRSDAAPNVLSIYDVVSVGSDSTVSGFLKLKNRPPAFSKNIGARLARDHAKPGREFFRVAHAPVDFHALTTCLALRLRLLPVLQNAVGDREKGRLWVRMIISNASRSP